MKHILLFSLLSMSFFVMGQTTEFKSNCAQVYFEHPKLTRGVLEAVSWTQTRFQARSTDNGHDHEACSGIPQPIGTLALMEDGQGYFHKSFQKVSKLSGISESQMKASQLNELRAYALAFVKLTDTKYGESLDKKLIYAFSELSYLADAGYVNDFARQSELYELFRFLNDPVQQASLNFPNYNFDLKMVFGENNFKILSASKILAQIDYKF